MELSPLNTSVRKPKSMFWACKASWYLIQREFSMKCKRLTIQKILVSCANRALNHSSGSSECLVLHKLRLEQQQRFILSRQIKSLASGAVIQNSLSIISQTTNWRTCSQPSISSGQDALTVVHTEKAAPLIRAGGLPREWSRRRPRFKVKGCR